MEAINLCSCCLVNSPHKSLKMPYIYFGTTEVFLELLEECFQIQLSVDNEDGGGICEECEGRLRDASDFKRQVQRCQAKMQARRARRETIVLVKDEEPLEITDESVTCDEPVSNEEPPAPSEAPIDDAIPEDGVISLSWSGNAGAVARLARRVSTRIKKQQATTCSVKLVRLRSATHACAECPATFDTASSLTKHMETVHDHSYKADVFICDTCGKVYKRKLNLINHMKAHTKRSSMYASNLNDFMVIIPGKKPYGCKICKKQFKIKYCLSRHTVVHTKLKSFKCDICNKLFTYKHDLTRHVIIHTGKKPYSCKLCPKSFTQKTGLNQHMSIHTGLRPYVCPICLKTFAHKQLMANHVRIHTGQKPYKCEICKKSFTEKGQLRKHTRVHTGQRPYSCEICDRKFAQKIHVAFHQSRVHTSLNPQNIKLKIDGTIEFPTRDSKTIEQPSSTENDFREDWNSTLQINRAVPISVQETGKALDKEASIDKSLKFWTWNDSIIHSHEAKDTDQSSDKEASVKNNSNADVKDSTAKLDRLVSATVKESEEVVDKLASKENDSKAKKKAKHGSVVPASVIETGKALEKELLRENNSREDLKNSRLRKRKPGGITQVSHKKRHKKVHDDKRIRKFTDHVYRQTLRAFEQMKEKSDSFTRQQIDTLVKSFKEKFTDFVGKTKETFIKTREGARNVLIHIIETSNLMMERIVSFLKENMVATDELGPGGLRGGALRLDQEVDAVKQLEYEYACKNFGVCRNNEGFRVILQDLTSILLKLPDSKLIHINDAATEVLKNMDLSKISQTEDINRIIKKGIKKQERTTAAMLRFALTILYGTLSKSHLPLIVNKAVYFEKPAVQRTVAFHGFIDALEDALPPTEANKREWAMAKDRLKRWVDGQPVDIQEIIQALFYNMMAGIAKSKRAKELIAELVKPLE